jgi:protein-export membrane protein SecD
MQKNLKWKYLLIIVVIGLAAWRGFLGLSAYLAKPQTEEQQRIVDMQKLSLGLDLRGGMYLVLEVDTSGLPEEAKRDATARAIEVIRNRIDQFGVREPYIHRQGRNRIVVQLPGITNRERALDLIGKTALLEFKLVSDDSDKLKEAVAGNVPQGYELKYSKDEEEPLLVETEASVTGDMLKTANVKFDQSKFNEPIVALELNSKGARRFARVTGENVGRRLAIILDGEVYLAPRINERIPSGQAVITGRFSQDEAADIAIVLRAGALPAPIRIEEERTVGPTLGKDSIKKGVRAIMVGGILVFVFMIGYYFLSGLIADLALVLNLIILVGVLSYLHASLTLPGLAGIALTLGMAVDANVLINERIREEIRFGKHIRSAITSGYRRAFITIFDANTTTLIPSL